MLPLEAVSVVEERKKAKPNLALVALAFAFCWPLAIWMMWHYELGSKGERTAILMMVAIVGLYAVILAVSGTR